MKFGILVKESPYNFQAFDSAYNFVIAAIKKGHEITGIFFYDDAVYAANKYLDPPQGERNIRLYMDDLKSKGVRLVVCVAAGKRRGLTNDTVSGSAEISGLGQLLELSIESDRLITF
ncbi:MAG: sulfurtransferase complex subunit TusD [Deltaproteobacteria bacterium]|jgi:tRNA 2-thiouridine synthesizing protein D|uniref:Sulfurtransferase complex subunit TusD n=1 Tax=Candidatus Acididesulfobacter diazotrophicus TaxID=2597226 RepID=A0A519BMI6_9DELT|nr:sulfurtransferase complex subunit TusD [Deltaproteobacteria bacterium]RZD18487.1 MAG: sulfurtransferase complex subunit TusD [Candidatus Acididesulfobacter diazotrophicus]